MVYSISQVTLCDLVTSGKFSPAKVKNDLQIERYKMGRGGPFISWKLFHFIYSFFNYLKKPGIMTIILTDLFHWAPIIQSSN